jgi:hypothetical protein
MNSDHTRERNGADIQQWARRWILSEHLDWLDSSTMFLIQFAAGSSAHHLTDSSHISFNFILHHAAPQRRLLKHIEHLKGHLFGYGGITVVKGTEFLRFDLMIRHI